MPASRHLVRGGAAVGLTLLLTAVGTALADNPAKHQRDRAADTARSTVTSPYWSKGRARAESAAAQHGADTDHLPPTRKNVDLISKLEPALKGPIQQGQIADVNIFKGFAYLNSGWDATSCQAGAGGTFVIDIRDPKNPKEVTFLPAVKDQYHGEGAHAIHIDTPAFNGDVLALSNEDCQGTNPDKGGGFDLWNVTDPTKPTRFIPAAGADFTFGDYGGEGELTKGPGDDDKADSTHSIFIWDAGDKAYAVFVDNEEFHDVDIFDITNPASPQPVREYDLTEETPAWTETANGDNPFNHDMVVKKIGDKFVLLDSYWDAGYIEMDVTNPADAKYIADTDFCTSSSPCAGAADPEGDPLTGFDPPEGNAHQAEFTNDNKFILTGEEDFAADRLITITVQGKGDFPANAVGGGGSPNTLADGRLNGPMAYGGYACPDPDPSAGQSLRPVPDALTTFPVIDPGEERILVVQRGPDGDSNEDYDGDGNISDADDACFPGNKADRALDAGWDGLLIVNRHFAGGAAADEAYCGSGGYTRFMVTACTTHDAGHEIFDDPTTYNRPYDDETEMAAIGTVSAYKLDATGTFDGWGYMSMYSTTPDADQKLPFVDAFAIPEALNPDYSVGFGDLSVHEQATDPTEPLSYTSWYAGGMRVFSYEGGKLTHQGAFIDEGGNNFWGTEQFTGSDGERYFAGSDRDFGLYILKYTGPLAAKRPACTDSGTMVPFKGSATVPLSCLDANAGNTLTKSVVTNPAQGTVTNINQAAGTATYTHTGTRLGADSFTFKANDGAADSAPATARIQIVPANGGRCFNPFEGTAAAETIEGSAFGDRINAGGGNDVVNARQGADCVNGQAGRDQLSGNLGNDTLNGGGGRDRLFGESGRDRLNGGGGSDNMRGSSGNDRMTGGSGFDRIDGGSDNDRLFGNGGFDRLYGGPGRDGLNGGNGRDRLEGGAGTDRFSGGGGDDRIIADDGRKERIRCGAGNDAVRADNKDVVAGDCERILRVREVR
jgi:Ca2+-binding RTX toxin-like protein